MGKRALPTVEALSEAAKTRAKRGGRESQMTPRNKYAKAQEHDEGSKAGGGGAALGECRCSSLRVRGWWMLTMNSHGVEISIARCVEEMIYNPNPKPFFLFFHHLRFVSSSRYKKCMQRKAMA